MLLIRLALRNLLRNLPRTLISASAVCLGLAILIIGDGLADGAHNQMVKDGIAAQAGHVVLQQRDWQEKRDLNLTIPDAAEMAARFQSAIPGATVVSRIYFQGLLTSPSGSAGVGLSAVEPPKERIVDDIRDHLVQGTDLADAARGGAIVIGTNLAETLDVGIGDKVVLMAQHGPDIQSHLFRVTGIFSYGIDEIDGFFAQIPLRDAQDFLGLHDQVTQISAHLAGSRQLAPALSAARAAFPEPELDVLSWKQAMPDLYEWITIDSAGLYIMIMIMAVIVAMGILNTVLMSVLERVREFGVMLALGLKPGQLFRLVLWEALFLGIVATAVGLALGLAGNAYFTVHGLDYAELAGGSMEASGVALNSLIHSDLSPSKTVIFSLMALAITVISAVYPAWRASRLSPVDCLQHH